MDLQESSKGAPKTDNGSASARAILVFLPGAPEINRLVRALQASAALQQASQGKTLLILPLHGALAPAQQVMHGTEHTAWNRYTVHHSVSWAMWKHAQTVLLLTLPCKHDMHNFALKSAQGC